MISLWTGFRLCNSITNLAGVVQGNYGVWKVLWRWEDRENHNERLRKNLAKKKSGQKAIKQTFTTKYMEPSSGPMNRSWSGAAATAVGVMANVVTVISGFGKLFTLLRQTRGKARDERVSFDGDQQLLWKLPKLTSDTWECSSTPVGVKEKVEEQPGEGGRRGS